MGLWYFKGRNESSPLAGGCWGVSTWAVLGLSSWCCSGCPDTGVLQGLVQLLLSWSWFSFVLGRLLVAHVATLSLSVFLEGCSGQYSREMLFFL